MANYATLKAAIQNAIKQNGANEITGQLLQQQLLAMVNSLGANYQFAGVATPETNPGTPDYPIAYIVGSGTYPNMGGIVIAPGNIGVLSYNGTVWAANTINIPIYSTATTKIKELYLVGNISAYQNFRFQWLRTYQSGGNQVYQCRIAATSIETNNEIEIARISGDVVPASELLKIKPLIPRNNSGIGGFVILNNSGWGANYENDTSAINIVTAATLGMSNEISKHVENMQKISVLSSVVSKIDSAIASLIGAPIFFDVLGGFVYVPAAEISLSENFVSLCVCYDYLTQGWKYRAITDSNPALNTELCVRIAYFSYRMLSWGKWNEKLLEQRGAERFNGTGQLPLTWYIGKYFAGNIKVGGIRVKLYNNSSDLSVFVVDTKTGMAEQKQVFAAASLSVGFNYLQFTTPFIIGGRYQLVVNGEVCYEPAAQINYQHKIVRYYPDEKRTEIHFDVNIYCVYLAAGTNGLYNNELNDLGESVMSVGDNSIDYFRELQPMFAMAQYTIAFTQLANIVFRYIPFQCKVRAITVNARATEEIGVYGIDLETKEYTLLKAVTPASAGPLTIALDSPFDVTLTKQIGVKGKIGYNYNPQAGKVPYGYFYFNTDTKELNVKIQTTDNIQLVGFGIQYSLTYSVGLADRYERAIYDLGGKVVDALARINPLENIVGSLDSYETVTVNIADYGNNLVNAFNAITPSAGRHYTVLIPEGVYNVDQWFSQSDIESSNDTHWRGLELPNYVKLLGYGCADKVILQWLNPDSATHWGYISTLNTHEWHELENLTVKANNIRYAVHDDVWNGLDRHIRVKNCYFIVSGNTTRAWGAGCNGGYDGVFENCKFIMEYYAPFAAVTEHRQSGSVSYVEPFVLHDNQYNVRGLSSLVFKNCRFDVPYLNYRYYYDLSWQQVAYDASKPAFDYSKTDYAVNDVVNMPGNTDYSYKCLTANTQLPPYAQGRPSVNIGFGGYNYDGTPKPLYITMIGCLLKTYMVTTAQLNRSTGFGNKFGSGPYLWNESQDSRSVIFDFLDN